MHFSILALPALLSGLSASAQTITGQYDCLPAGGYTLCQNLWGKASGVGSQNSTLRTATTESVSWVTSYTWANGPNQVKSYANVISNAAKGVQLQNVASAPTSWDWTYASQSVGIRADVSYDIWFGKASSGSPATSASSYEIMIWLSGLGGIQPVGSQITTGTVVANHTWNLWKGPNANWEVFSFVSAAGDLNSFDVDLNDFFSKYKPRSDVYEPIS
ncbi:Xyloglucan-specific endo-beta-1,4-glucanase A [Mycena sanguinolenta]|uniref:Xyloglucan-specific endo-beta-1,4-glucanase A n=1 Tax=Mycena sanguinolenta TaxID=230812 RepID=A0A8H6Y2K1_9AGAR|nr:Xyloglucan-specific endo-beta-1,4-glucanase A [Mycena sanguinolenta]